MAKATIARVGLSVSFKTVYSSRYFCWLCANASSSFPTYFRLYALCVSLALSHAVGQYNTNIHTYVHTYVHTVLHT